MKTRDGGNPVVAFLFTVNDDRIASVEVAMSPERLKKLEISIAKVQEGKV